MLTAFACVLLFFTNFNSSLLVCGVAVVAIAVTTQTSPYGISLPQDGFVRLPTILAVFPVSRSSWWAGVKTGRYPSPVKLGPRVTAWRVEDIRALLDSIPASDGANASQTVVAKHREGKRGSPA